jgi:signal peptidase I
MLTVVSFCADGLGYQYTFRLTFGRSMFPTIRNSDVVLVQKGAENIKVGDIISFKTNLTMVPVIHRVVRIEENHGLVFKTKGDGNEFPDTFEVKTEDIIGKAVMIIPISCFMTPFFLLSTIFLCVISLSKKLLDYHNQKSVTVLSLKHLMRDPTTVLLLVDTALSIGSVTSLMILTNI